MANTLTGKVAELEKEANEHVDMDMLNDSQRAVKRYIGIVDEVTKVETMNITDADIVTQNYMPDQKILLAAQMVNGTDTTLANGVYTVDGAGNLTDIDHIIEDGNLVEDTSASTESEIAFWKYDMASDTWISEPLATMNPGA